MRIIVLGAAAGGGFPQWNSACPVGQRAWQGDPAAPWRSQCSLAISVDGDDWALLNAAPDLRQQILATPALHPRVRHPKITPRHSPIRAVVLTNGDVDHVAGLLCLRESQPFELFASGAILEVLAQNPIFNVLNPSYVTRHPLTLERAVEVLPGLTVVPFAVPGKVALYLEDETPEVGAETEATIGLELRDRERGARLLRAGLRPGHPGAGGAPGWRRSRVLRRHALDRRRDDSEPTGVKTGARMGHISVSGRERLARGARRPRARPPDLSAHQQHQPDPARGLPGARPGTAAGWEVACDGMEIEL